MILKKVEILRIMQQSPQLCKCRCQNATAAMCESVHNTDVICTDALWVEQLSFCNIYITLNMFAKLQKEKKDIEQNISKILGEIRESVRQRSF